VHGRTSLDASHDDEKAVQSTLQNKYETREFGEQIALYLKNMNLSIMHFAATKEKSITSYNCLKGSTATSHNTVRLVKILLQSMASTTTAYQSQSHGRFMPEHDN
jgi:hypothetical protein